MVAPLRDAAAQAALCHHVRTGTFGIVFSDHAPHRLDATGKLSNGPEATFGRSANGMPGVAVRLPLLFPEGVAKGRITLQQFVALSATNAVRTRGMRSRKGDDRAGVGR